MPAALRPAADVYERYTGELSRACEALLRKFGKSIADQQLQLKRIADIAIDLYVGLCVTSRAAALANAAGQADAAEQGSGAASAAPQSVRAVPMKAEAEQAVAIAQMFARQAKRRIAGNLRRLERNEDAEMNRLAGFILDKGRYLWDVM